MKETIIIGGRTNKTTTTLKEIIEKKEKEEFAITEIEKLKAEIFFHNNPIYEKEKIEEIIDKHISELKGEDK